MIVIFYNTGTWYDAMVVNYTSNSVIYDRSNVYSTGHRCRLQKKFYNIDTRPSPTPPATARITMTSSNWRSRREWPSTKPETSWCQRCNKYLFFFVTNGGAKLIWVFRFRLVLIFASEGWSLPQDFYCPRWMLRLPLNYGQSSMSERPVRCISG
jgi:hypothetical protein